MDIGTVMNVMRDPAGIPAHPELFRILMIVTWVFHIAFVTLTLGAASLAIYAFWRRDTGPYWTRLSIAMTKVAKVGVSLLIVLGVAPLLFTQVIYDPQWYASNVLSAGWAIGFIFTLIIAYCLWFAFYFSNKEGAKRHIGIFAVIALLLFLLDGLIMHALSYQALLPGQWMDWYAPDGVVDTRGAYLHAIQWPRYFFIISLSVPAIGLYLLAYDDYLKSRPDLPEGYLGFVRPLGRKLGASGSLFALILFVWWQFDNPSDSNLIVQPGGWAVGAALLVLWFEVTFFADKLHGYLLLCGGLVVLLLLAIWREVVRATYLSAYGYSIVDQKINADWPSLALFFLTLAGVGGLVGGFYLSLLYRAGRVQGVYQADRSIAAMGTGAVAVLAVWIAVFFLYGIAIFIENTFAY
ncbi:hypothetical protein AUC68_06060 [Methyloceanibacter methanicus]|uniref:Uncharacterized protein n=1 Tax=Methyloceanibacter methanicus TaxID=1774968 RepID=A0A1E3VZT8_9HYPH|nr:hypothetical protein [Methyloceanibacter methanicus]ODR98771.1 hypothetical protein AUC68_06060 [Methyloceanibacter methanicus]